MPINPSIPLGVQPLQLPQRDPNAGMNALARMMQISSAMDEQKVNALRMRELQRGVDNENAMNEVYARVFGDAKPARSTVAVAGLPRDVRVEIELVALLD